MSSKYLFYDAEGRPREVGSVDEAYCAQADDAKVWRDRAITADADITLLVDACERLLKFNEEMCKDVGVSTHYPSADNARSVLARVRQRTSGLPVSRG